MAVQYLVTGAAGHLGNTVVSLLAKRGLSVRTLMLPGDNMAHILKRKAELFFGDITNLESIKSFFSLPPGDEAIVIHAAGIVSIASKFDQRVYDVNVGGTQNILKMCQQINTKKLVHVSSVHAIPELPGKRVITEADRFHPDLVMGLYAKTKAEATALVLKTAKQGLDASVVHPSGICGPYDYGKGHLTQLLIDYYKGRLSAGIDGGYDFVDVRDVAAGIISCCANGKKGECYILSNRYYALKELFEIFHQISGKKQIRTILPMWFAKGTAPLAETYYRLLKQPPLYTSYSLYTLSGDVQFSHKKADMGLGYHVRPMEETVKDTLLWLKTQERI